MATGANAFGLWPTLVATIPTTLGQTQPSETAGRIIGYLLGIFVVITVILLFINYYVTPVFQLNPGGPGVIPVPGMSDGTTYWTKSPTSPISDTATPIGTQTSNWSMTLDFFIKEPISTHPYPRVLFHRGLELQSSPSSALLTDVAPNYNIAIALTPDTTDMIVSAQNANNNMENILIPNVPVQTPFRVGVVLMDSAIEVYLNGRLLKTRTFSAPLKQTIGQFWSPQGDMAAIASVRNLHLWKRPISPSEMRYAQPQLASAASFSPPSKHGSGSSTGICF